MRQRHSSEVSRLTEDLRSLRTTYDAKFKEYEELLDVKVQLDQEIATYRALLEEEESRSDGETMILCLVGQHFKATFHLVTL